MGTQKQKQQYKHIPTGLTVYLRTEITANMPQNRSKIAVSKQPDSAYFFVNPDDLAGFTAEGIYNFIRENRHKRDMAITMIESFALRSKIQTL